ncbi:775fce28-acbb-4c8b-b130-41bd021ad237 [Thermothielavioides terrestris]|uniref:Mid2 domain-containing protein n=2 Tax=Thermothielavioides terrestris TaxID=2587410 RepID=G2QXR4_THETT|nr:uncharacterized protein THITE_2039581 [Thermothielavioides terrestris NRRL 8126]AEO62382.1 hypothetical protein THITE_2039581 [Thermothielavioides terrestris NRRL 8126]SPQ22141.1 775fce28-acbb-4c8b-b130-41bd021ad237 [Thermothielavioides terrestris]
MKLGSLVAALTLAGSRSAADFTNTFDGITSGSSVSLTWDGVPAQQYPLCITAQVIVKTGDGFKANAYRVNLTTDASGPSYVWAGVPFPLRRVRSGIYQVELRSASSAGGDTPVLAKSPYFSVGDPGIATGSSPQPTLADSQGGGASGINKPVAIGLGVAIGVPSIAALIVVGWCFRKRQRKAALEKSRLKRSEFVIT